MSVLPEIQTWQIPRLAGYEARSIGAGYSGEAAAIALSLVVAPRAFPRRGVTKSGAPFQNFASYFDEMSRLRRTYAYAAGNKGYGVTGVKNSGASLLNRTWHKGTFPNKMQSVRHHLRRHGKNRSASHYTQDAMNFFRKNRHLGQDMLLLDGSPGIMIKTKIRVQGQKTQRVGGFWTQDGRLVTFWD